MSSEKRPFGPFIDVPVEDIKPAGFMCWTCRQAVERLTKAFPSQVVRMFFYACSCGTIICWEDERQPRGSRHWRLNIKLMRASRTKVLIFNGNRPLSADFSGTN